MRNALFLALLLLVAPAWSDELIRFRQADGTLGLVDHPDKLPPGAVVLERTPLERPSESPAAADAYETDGDADAGADAGDEDDDTHQPGTFTIEPRSTAERGELAPGDADASRENAALCSRYHLDFDCTAADRDVAADWCRRSTESRGRLEIAEEELELAQAEFDRCDDLSGSYYCSRLRLDAAVSAFEKEEVAVERMENACRKEDCLPGWTREGCEP